MNDSFTLFPEMLQLVFNVLAVTEAAKLVTQLKKGGVDTATLESFSATFPPFLATISPHEHTFVKLVLEHQFGVCVQMNPKRLAKFNILDHIPTDFTHGDDNVKQWSVRVSPTLPPRTQFFAGYGSTTPLQKFDDFVLAAVLYAGSMLGEKVLVTLKVDGRNITVYITRLENALVVTAHSRDGSLLFAHTINQTSEGDIFVTGQTKSGAKIINVAVRFPSPHPPLAKSFSVEEYNTIMSTVVALLSRVTLELGETIVICGEGTMDNMNRTQIDMKLAATQVGFYVFLARISTGKMLSLLDLALFGIPTVPVIENKTKGKLWTFNSVLENVKNRTNDEPLLCQHAAQQLLTPEEISAGNGVPWGEGCVVSFYTTLGPVSCKVKKCDLGQALPKQPTKPAS